MVSTGRKKFSNVGLSIAAVAVPLNHLRPTAVLANTAMKSTPDTYSGVAVVVMAKVESVRSVRDPSRIPARIPNISADGTISTITQNMSLPVSASLSLRILPTSSRNTVE